MNELCDLFHSRHEHQAFTTAEGTSCAGQSGFGVGLEHSLRWFWVGGLAFCRISGLFVSAQHLVLALATVFGGWEILSMEEWPSVQFESWEPQNDRLYELQRSCTSEHDPECKPARLMNPNK